VLEQLGVRILEGLFFAGMAGSAIVVVLTAIEDIETLSASDDTPSNSPVAQ
jgi:hypothetical protein